VTEQIIETESIWSKLFNELGETNDRVTAIVGQAFLDEHLRQLIATFLIDSETYINKLLNEKGGRPLGSFGARVIAAYCLGLISEDEYHDLRRIQRIRNELAHELDLSFTDQSIKDECDKLKLPKKSSFFLSERHASKPRNQFTGAIILLGILLEHRTSIIEEQGHRAVPDEIELEPIITRLFDQAKEQSKEK